MPSEVDKMFQDVFQRHVLIEEEIAKELDDRSRAMIAYENDRSNEKRTEDAER